MLFPCIKPLRLAAAVITTRCGGAFMRSVILAAAISMSVVGLSAAQSARAAIRTPVDIEPMPLEDALDEFSRVRGVQIAFVLEDISGRRSAGASGELTEQETLTQILGGTGLAYRY